MKLKTYMQRHFLSVADVAAQTGLTRPTIYRALRGDPVSMRTVLRISTRTGGSVTLRDLGRGGAR